MTISVITELPTISLARNEIKLPLSSDNKYSTAGLKDIKDILITGGAPVADDTIRFQWTDIDGNAHGFTYTWKASPSGNFQFATKGPGDYMDDYVKDFIIPVLQKNYYLIRDYDISWSGNVTDADIKFTSKTYGTGQALTIIDNAGDLSVVATQAGEDPVVRSNFAVALDLFIEEEFGKEIYTRIAQLESSCENDDGTDTAVFFLERFLVGYLAKNLPAYNASTIAYAETIFKRFFLFYAEKYGDAPVYYDWTRYPASGYKYALMGGLDEKTFPGNGFVADYWTATARKFLTNMPNNMKVSPSVQLYLFLFFNNVSNAEVQLWYTDGTSETKKVLTGSHSGNKAMIVPAGYNQLNIDGIKAAGKTVYRYDFAVYNGVTRVSEVKSFLVDHNNYENSRCFLFMNRFGAFDTLWCRGKFTRGVKVDMESLLMIPDNSNASTSKVYEGSLVSSMNESRDTMTANTGYMKSAAEMAWLQEFLESPAVYAIENGGFHKVIIDTKEAELYKDDEHGYALEFKYTYALETLKG